ncbi:MAG: GNAT family N-acetyltransferase [Bacteroidota bacterium]|jgi:ribosomal protein S18 acetylase RimI-like enzyme|uniref:GNAT family N-acetyltransferase n=1 Tax=Candidatus Pollutiaquabacter sp. TaxID=3416354 RepID=UPI001A39E82C|nr:GNAT family N-acetyltransferase [Bacteroidota bacterium]MBL7948290.1 GNAT family N-acetyltransferase [Bacteroidia bacterium]MBP6009197.1 GNAT family N-acetyltransferase [Bacteroidia bacterium]MBP7270505.1 GNAT family N-acetyltransferase [Bacteroidia bacterium]MBP7437548.1 GNAT family N-acetyltransferase [Bacteroidia bacterium]
MDKRDIQVREYRPEWRSDFRNLNVSWLAALFSVTAEDERQLGNPEAILEKGGMIFFAVLEDRPIGTVAVIPDSPSSIQVAKMGVDERCRGLGAGNALLDAALRWSVSRNFTTIHLDTADQLVEAIRLYERAGFRRKGDHHVHPVFKRTTFRMELAPEALERYRSA